jgi:hypothetical protein
MKSIFIGQVIDLWNKVSWRFLLVLLGTSGKPGMISFSRQFLSPWAGGRWVFKVTCGYTTSESNIQLFSLSLTGS